MTGALILHCCVGASYAGAGQPAAAGYAQPSIPGTAAATGPEPTLRQLVEQYAQDAGVEFLPKAGRRHNGLQVYGFGGVSCIVDAAAGIVQAHIGGNWVPTSLEQLLQEARKRQRL